MQQLRVWDLTASTFPALTAAETTAVLRELEAAVAPGHPSVIAALIAETIALWRAPNQADVTAGFYVEALEEFPAHVVAEALKRVRLSHHYPNAPLPADFRKHALDLAAPLRGALVRARIAAKRYADAEARAARAAQRPVPSKPTEPLPPRPALVRDRSDGKREIDLGNVDANLRRWANRAGEGEV